jgi:lipoprotein-releasing system permease protein
MDRVIIGKQMAHTLGGIGSTLQVYFPRGSLTPFGMGSTISSRTFRVTAIFDSGLYDYDSNWIYINIASARRLFSMPEGSASVLQFKTDNAEGVQAIADQIKDVAGTEYFVTTWIELNRALFSALNLEKLVLFITIGLIVLVASLNIITTLIMMVLEKQADIAILTAMGAPPKIILHIFMLQGLIIGFIGTILGACLGVAVSWAMNAYRLIPLEPEIYAIPYVPFHVRFWDVAIVAVTALLISFLATLYPARSASRLNPVEVLRYE